MASAPYSRARAAISATGPFGLPPGLPLRPFCHDVRTGGRLGLACGTVCFVCFCHWRPQVCGTLFEARKPDAFAVVFHDGQPTQPKQAFPGARALATRRVSFPMCVRCASVYEPSGEL